MTNTANLPILPLDKEDFVFARCRFRSLQWILPQDEQNWVTCLPLGQLLTMTIKITITNLYLLKLILYHREGNCSVSRKMGGNGS